MKKTIFGLLLLFVFILAYFFISNGSPDINSINKLIIENSILYSNCIDKTNSLPEKANLSFEEGEKYIDQLVDQRELLYKKSKELENESRKLSKLEINKIYAYDAQEITNIIDKAPPGKKIKTLAKELNISAEKAFTLLKMSQQQLTAEAWNNAGDTFETLENTTRLIQDGCKVGLMVGGSAIAGPAGTLETAALIINGVDLVLQIGEDTSNIALGYNNKAAAVFGDIRKITEPGAAIIGFAGLYNAGGKITSTIDAFTYTFEQTNNIIQDNKVLGIKFKKEAIELDTMDDTEVNNWLVENNIPTQAEKSIIMQEIAQLAKTIQEETANKENNPPTQTPNTKSEERENNEKIEEISEKIDKEKENKNIFGEWDVNVPINGKFIKGGIYTINEDGTMKLETEGQSITTTWKFTDNDTIEAYDTEDGGKMIFKIKDDSIEWSQIQYGDQTANAGGITLTRKNNNQLTEETNNDNTKKSLAGTKWEIIDGSTHGFMEFAETEIQAGIMVNGEKMGNTVTMKYTYKDGKGYYGSDDPKAIQRVEITLKGDNLILTTKQGQVYKYHLIR